MNIEHVENLIEYLRFRELIPRCESPSISFLTGGVSNRTLLLHRPGGESWVIKQSLPKLRVQDDWHADPARIHREALALQHLPSLLGASSTPEFLFEDPTLHLLGMRAIPQPHLNWKAALLAGNISPALVREFGSLLGRLHCQSREQRHKLEPLFADRRFFHSLRLDPYYRTAAGKTKTHRFMESLIEECLASPSCLVHGDYSPKNLLVRHEHLILLDHEVMHWGDPAFDLGFALTHMTAKAIHRPQDGALFLCGHRWFWQSYLEATPGLPADPAFESRVVRHHLACLLARVDGRSPLEYLDHAQRARQRDLALRALEQPPASVPEWFQVLDRELTR